MTEADTVVIDAVVTDRSERAARWLVERHSPRLLAVVRRLLANDAGAAVDVVQQAWVNGIGALRTFRRDASFSTWMTRIAIRVALDHLRRLPAPHELPEALSTDAASPSHDIDERLDLERLIAQLPSECRGVLVLHDIEGFTRVSDARHLARVLRRDLTRTLHVQGAAHCRLGRYDREGHTAAPVPRRVRRGHNRRLSNSSPVVTRDSTGTVLIRIGEHVVRLGRAQ